MKKLEKIVENIRTQIGNGFGYTKETTIDNSLAPDKNKHVRDQMQINYILLKTGEKTGEDLLHEAKEYRKVVSYSLYNSYVTLIKNYEGKKNV